MKPLSPAELVWMRASHAMLFAKRDKAPRELKTPRVTGEDNVIEPIPAGEWPWMRYSPPHAKEETDVE